MYLCMECLLQEHPQEVDPELLSFFDMEFFNETFGEEEGGKKSGEAGGLPEFGERPMQCERCLEIMPAEEFPSASEAGPSALVCRACLEAQEESGV